MPSDPPSLLASTIVGAEVSAATRTVVLLHGIYGRGRNWAAIARGLAARRPEWASALVDLRLHGASPAFEPPHTVAACAADVRDRIAHADDWPAPVDAVVGHSFGGKVALSLLADGAAPPQPLSLAQVWIVDSSPSAGEPAGTAWRMLGLVRALPQRVATRAEAIDGLTAGGIAPDVAAWMASNLRRDGDGLVWALDWDAMEALLRDFFARDLWPVVEAPPAGVALHFIKASESSRLSDGDVARIEAAGQATGRVHLHHVEGGHWIHADNPAVVTALLADALP
jgi:pimeloyl-ACP methyl ester carboxylesterase